MITKNWQRSLFYRVWFHSNRRKSSFLHGELQKTVGNLHFSTENYKKLTEISISSQRITKNRQKSPFLHRELQKTVGNLHFSTENCKKLSAESFSLPRNPYTSEKGSDFLLFWRFLLQKTRNAWFCIYV